MVVVTKVQAVVTPMIANTPWTTCASFT